MLAIPTVGFNRSVGAHNVELGALCDWIEGSLLFSEARISAPEIADALCENEIYEDKDFANELITDAWTELRRRHDSLSLASPYRFDRLSIQALGDIWNDRPAHAFCVLLSLARLFREWAKGFGPDYTVQGELFERVTEEALGSWLRGWVILRTGWSRTKPIKLNEVVAQVATAVAEPVNSRTRWNSARGNEAGLDIVCARGAADRRGGLPVLFIQCASGIRWNAKLSTPDLDIWREYIRFSAPGFPIRGFATPFALLNEEFAKTCTLVKGLVFDRIRILSAQGDPDGSFSPTLAAEMVSWGKPRMMKLPKLE